MDVGGSSVTQQRLPAHAGVIELFLVMHNVRGKEREGCFRSRTCRIATDPNRVTSNRGTAAHSLLPNHLATESRVLNRRSPRHGIVSTPPRRSRGAGVATSVLWGLL